jgi:hypothetical protein
VEAKMQEGKEPLELGRRALAAVEVANFSLAVAGNPQPNKRENIIMR